MGTQIFEKDDDSLVLVTEEESPVVVHSAPVSTIVAGEPARSIVLPVVDGRDVVVTGGPVQEIIKITREGEYFRVIVNYDGGFPGSQY